MRLTIVPNPDGSGSRLGEPEALFKDEHRQASAAHARAGHMERVLGGHLRLVLYEYHACSCGIPSQIASDGSLPLRPCEVGSSMKWRSMWSNWGTDKVRATEQAFRKAPYQICQKNELWIAHPIEFGRVLP